MSLTVKQRAALQAASGSTRGQIFQLPESRKHSPKVLTALVKAGLLKSEPVGVIWTITAAGRDELAKAQ
jgi:hypothetical protein